jgi:hypothetical protein
MKRIAAVAALAIPMLAVPTAAMASTSSPGSGSGHHGSSPFVCQPGYYNGHHRHHKYHKHYRHHRHAHVQAVCAFPPPFPPYQQQVCEPQSFTFDVTAGSSAFTEVSGPTLAAGEEFTYDGSTYTIWTVNPGANSFTASTGAFMFVNSGSDITDATATLVCSG